MCPRFWKLRGRVTLEVFREKLNLGCFRESPGVKLEVYFLAVWVDIWLDCSETLKPVRTCARIGIIILLRESVYGKTTRRYTEDLGIRRIRETCSNREGLFRRTRELIATELVR